MRTKANIRKPKTYTDKNKDADQLCGNCTADLGLCFLSHIQIVGFLMRQLTAEGIITTMMAQTRKKTGYYKGICQAYFG